MKKQLSIILAVLMVLGSFSLMSFSVSAEESTAPKNVADVVPEADANLTLRFYMPADWQTGSVSSPDECAAGIYWWDSSYAPSEWPGYKVTDKEAGNVFTAKVPADIKSVIFNNSVSGKPEAEKQTVNINAKGYAANENKFGFYPEGLDSVDGMIFVCNADYKNPTDDKSCEGSWFYYYGNGEYGAYKTKAEAEENKGVYSKGEFPKTPEKPAEPTVEPTAKPTQPQTAKAETAKKENTLKVTAKAKSVNAKKLKKSKVTVSAITVKNAKGKVSYKKLSGSKKLSVTKKGKITVKKGTKKGTYKLKVKITAKGNSQYLAKSVTKTVKVKVK